MKDIRILRFARGHCPAMAGLVKRVFPDRKYALLLTAEDIARKTFDNHGWSNSGGYVALHGDRMIGAAIGSVAELEKTRVGFISLLAVTAAMRNRGIGTSLLERIEGFLRSKRVSEIRTCYYDNSAWFLPGVDLSCPGYAFLMNRGFRSYSPRIGIYMIKARRGRNFGQTVKDCVSRNRDHGVECGLCTEQHRKGLLEFMREHFSGWRSGVAEALNADPPRSVVIATHGNKVVGFAGPISVSVAGLGMFGGIGVNQKYRGRKIGKILFARLCEEIEKAGAKCIYLWTGVKNPAQEMYFKAGFRVTYLFDLGLAKMLESREQSNDYGREA